MINMANSFAVFLNEKLKPVEEAPPEIQIQAPEAQPEQNNGEQ